MKKKLAFVIQRYGLEVNGGAELHCRQLAEHLKDDFDVEVLTTCAIDYYTWKNEYKEGETEINGIKVIRFPVDFERDKKDFDNYTQKAFANPGNLEIGEEWMKKQGPYSSKLFSYIEDNQNDYDYIIFFTYLYANTYFGMQKVKDKSKVVLVPTAHDEPPIYLKIFDSVFSCPSKIIYNTYAERNFVFNRFNNNRIENIVAGVGVEFPERYSENHGRFKAKYNLDHYALYVGRIDESKGCKEMFEYFLDYKRNNPSSLKLVLFGKEEIIIPKTENDDIVSLGFVSDNDKFDGIFGADFLIIPSRYESLSMVLLESFLCGKPVLVNGKSEVLKDHCISSNGGLWYENKFEFVEECDDLLYKEDYSRLLGENGGKYVMENYSWHKIIEKVIQILS
ncbi:MAG: glycosyltransferase family 4 protein [Clostridia bacterium]|nr:glycosyltransferase family 4 protein [Clostridia bacterium]